jgi:hypothetical protein
MSTQQNNLIIKLPVDLTPAQRARIKVYEQFVIIALFNGLLAGLVYISNQQVISWSTVAIVVIAQAALALLNAVQKYWTANNQQPLSVLFGLIRQQAEAEIATRTPEVKYTPAQQAIQQAVNDLLFKQFDASPNAAATAAKPATISASQSDLTPQTAPAPTTPAPAAPEYPGIPDDAELLNSIPNLPAVNPPAQ